MTQVPVEQRLAFGERRQMLGLDEALHGDRAQIGDVEIVSRLEPLDGCRIERDRSLVILGGRGDQFFSYERLLSAGRDSA